MTNGQLLLLHETADLAEWGASGSLAWDPSPASELGPAMTVPPSIGGPTAAEPEHTLSVQSTVRW